jgi:hypothetical protein
MPRLCSGGTTGSGSEGRPGWSRVLAGVGCRANKLLKRRTVPEVVLRKFGFTVLAKGEEVVAEDGDHLTQRG